MTEIRAADPTQERAWLDRWVDRLTAWFALFRAEDNVARRRDGWDRATDRMLGLIVADGLGVGHIALARHNDGTVGPVPDAVALHDIWVDPAHRRLGYGGFARAYAERWCRERGAPILSIPVWEADPGVAALFSDYPLRNQRMYKELRPVDLSSITYRAMRAEEFRAWVEREVAGYVHDITASGSATRDQAETQAAATYTEFIPQGLATPGHSFWVVESDGALVATIWLGHAYRPGLSFVYSVSTVPQARGRGFGRAAMLVGEDRALAAGDRSLGLNVFGHNTVAINLYTSLNYQVSDSIRSIAP